MSTSKAKPPPAFVAFFAAFILGIFGTCLVFSVAWVLAADAASKTQRAVAAAYKPGLSELIYTQAMSESLARSGDPASSEAQTQVFALAEAMKEREEFDVGLADFAARGITTALKTACLEDRVVSAGLALIVPASKNYTMCKAEVYPQNLRATQERRDALERNAEEIRSDMATASVSAEDQGYPEAEAKRRTLSWQETLTALDAGYEQLYEAAILVENRSLRDALDLMRGYDVSSQSDLRTIEDESDSIEGSVPQTRNWHERHHDALADDPIWTDLKLSAGDLREHLEFVSSDISAQYHNLGGVEGSIAAYLDEERRSKGTKLLASRAATVAKGQELKLALTSAGALRSQLLLANALATRREESERAALQGLLFGLQAWHLTWGLLAGLITALMTDRAVWVYRLLVNDKRHEPLNPAVPLVGFLLGTIASIRLGDRLDELTTVLISLALATSWKYFISIFGAMLLFSVIGHQASFLIAPEKLRARSRANIWLSGIGGALGGLVLSLALNALTRVHYKFGSSATVASGYALVLALVAIGSLVGTIMGPALSAGPLGRLRDRSSRSHSAPAAEG